MFYGSQRKKAALAPCGSDRGRTGGTGKRIFRRGRGHDPGAYAHGPLWAGAPPGVCHIGGGDPAALHALGRDLLVPGDWTCPWRCPIWWGTGGGISGVESCFGGSISCGCAGFLERFFSMAEGRRCWDGSLVGRGAGGRADRHSLGLRRGRGDPSAPLSHRGGRYPAAPGPGDQSALFPAHSGHGALLPCAQRVCRQETAAPAILAGLAGTALAAWVATGLEVELLHRCFGGFLLVVGVRELFARPR